MPSPLSSTTEWQIGRFSFPYEVLVAGEPIRPSVILCLELPRGVIVEVAMNDPTAPLSCGNVLRDAIRRPKEGPPRRPRRVRVPSESVADEIRDGAGTEIPVVVGPTPELDQAFQMLVESMQPMKAPGYFDGGASPDAMERLFYTANLFFLMAPWRIVDDSQIVGADIPALGVRGACLSVIGALGESLGLLVFPSIDEFHGFLAESEGGSPRPGSRAEFMSLNFDRKRDMPKTMLAEIKQNKWPVAGSKAYPSVMAMSADGTLRVATERDVRVVTACAGAFIAFFDAHQDLFQRPPLFGISETYSGEEGIAVTITAPYLDDSEMVPDPSRRTRRTTGSKRKAPAKRKGH